jgi:hypothetical protein
MQFASYCRFLPESGDSASTLYFFRIILCRAIVLASCPLLALERSRKGNDTNIANETVRRCYYDDDTWRDLQKLKKEMDGDDLFHTAFTVQLP